MKIVEAFLVSPFVSAVVALLAVGLGLGAASPVGAAEAFRQDFEAGLGPNETVSGSFTINASNLNNGTLMMGHPGVYPPNDYSYYEVMLDLSDFLDAELQFDFAANFDTHFDRFNVQVSTCPVLPPGDLVTPVSGMTYRSDHTHRAELGPTYFDSAFEKSGTAVFDLSAFSLEPQVCIRLQFGACCGVEREGITFDNFVVSGTPQCFEADAVDDQFDTINDGSLEILPVQRNDRCLGDEPVEVVRLPGDLEPDRGGVATTDGTTVSYRPAPGFVGFEEFSYTIVDAGLDGGGAPPTVDQDSARVVVNVIEDVAPDAVDDLVEGLQNQSLFIDVLANDALGNGSSNAVTIESLPENGSLSIQPDQTIRYSPAFGFFGEDSFQYRLTDVNGDFDVATVTVGLFFVRGTVPIDIMPTDGGNNVNLQAGPGAGFSVALLSVGPYLDAPATIDPLSLKLGPRQANIWGNGRVRDVNGDGYDDLLVKFLTTQTGIACGDTNAILSGRTVSGQSINGSDAINTFNCPRVRKRY